MGIESMMLVLVGMWWIAGTVYFPFAASLGVRPLSDVRLDRLILCDGVGLG